MNTIDLTDSPFAGGSRVVEQPPPELFMAVMALNIFDGLATVYWVETGVATEANPLMASLLAVSPALLIAVKIALVGLGLGILWQLRSRKLAAFAVKGAAVAYGALFVYHLIGAIVISGYPPVS